MLKMECQVEKLEHFRHNLVFEFNRGAKAAEAARNICAVYGATMSSERARQENGVLVLRRILLTLVTLHVQEDLRVLMKIV